MRGRTAPRIDRGIAVFAHICCLALLHTCVTDDPSLPPGLTVRQAAMARALEIARTVLPGRPMVVRIFDGIGAADLPPGTTLAGPDVPARVTPEFGDTLRVSISEIEFSSDSLTATMDLSVSCGLECGHGGPLTLTRRARHGWILNAWHSHWVS